MCRKTYRWTEGHLQVPPILSSHAQTLHSSANQGSHCHSAKWGQATVLSSCCTYVNDSDEASWEKNQIHLLAVDHKDCKCSPRVFLFFILALYWYKAVDFSRALQLAKGQNVICSPLYVSLNLAQLFMEKNVTMCLQKKMHPVLTELKNI